MSGRGAAGTQAAGGRAILLLPEGGGDMPVLRKQALFGLTALAGLATLLLVLTWNSGAPETQASNESADTVMSMVIEGTWEGSPVTCETPGDSLCILDDGSSFTVAMVPSTIPAGGYGFWQIFLSYGDLQYKPGPIGGGTDDGGEITWDLSTTPLRAPVEPAGEEGVVGYGNLSSLISPLPLSQQKTALVTLEMNCTSSDTLEMIDFDTRPDGSIYGGTEAAIVFVPEVHAIAINCGPPPPTPTPCPAGKDPSPGGGCGTPEPTPTATETPPPTPVFACGDVNGDSQVSSLDALWIRWLVAGGIDGVGVGDVADLNKDVATNEIDSLILLQFEAGLISALTCHAPPA